MGEATIKEKSSLITFEHILNRVVKWLAVVAAVFAFSIMIILVSDVIGSKFFNRGVPSALTFVEEMNVLIVFLALPYVQIGQEHIRVDLLESHMSPRLVKIFRLFGYVVTILVLILLSWKAFNLVKNGIDEGLFANGDVQFPLWIPMLSVFLGFAFLTLVYMLQFIKTLIIRPKTFNVTSK